MFSSHAPLPTLPLHIHRCRQYHFKWNISTLYRRPRYFKLLTYYIIITSSAHLVFPGEGFHRTDFPTSVLPVSRPHVDLRVVLQVLEWNQTMFTYDVIITSTITYLSIIEYTSPIISACHCKFTIHTEICSCN